MSNNDDHDKKGRILSSMQSALQGVATATSPDALNSIGPADLDKRHRADVDRKIREGFYPQISRRATKPGRIVPVPSILLRVPLFRYTHKAAHYTIDHPLRIETNWALAHYVGPALGQKELTVLASTVHVAGRGVLKGPRRSFSHLRLVGDSKRAITLDDPEIAERADPYEMLEAVFGKATLYEITMHAFGSVGGSQVNKTRAALLRLWDGRLYVQPQTRKGQLELPDWLRLENSETLVQDPKESALDGNGDKTGNLSVGMRRVLGYDSESGAVAPLRRFPLFDLFAENSLEPRGLLHFVFSPFLSELLNDRVTYLDLRVRQDLANDGLAQQLSSFISSMTSKAEPTMTLGYDKLIGVIGYENVLRKTKKLEGKEGGKTTIVEYLDRSGFQREIEKRCQKLEDIGFLKDWKSKPLADKARKTDKLELVRNFALPASEDGPQDNTPA